MNLTNSLDNRFDGDTASANALYSDDAVKEIQDYFKTKRAYVGTNGQFINSFNTDTISFMLFNLTGD